MGWEPKPRPAWVEELNGVGRRLGHPSALVPLDEDSLLACARETTGLTDFGDDGFREPFRLLIEGMEADADLHLVGRLMARADLVRSLVNRLRIAEAYRQQPEIGDEVVEGPVFVTGMGRSGTSLVHELLAADPAHRAPLTWELLYPCPPPERATYTTDTRIGEADREWGFWNLVTPEYRTMHDNRGDAPNECLFITINEFMSDYWSGGHWVPGYVRWLASADMRAAYRFHRRFLRLLQWRCPGRWVLKAPSHLSALPALFAEYPDARVVVTHRDPLKVLGSVVDLMATLLWQRSDAVHYDDLVANLMFAYPVLLDRLSQMRDDGTIPDDQIVDVRYRDLVGDPLGTMRQTYVHLGGAYTSEAEKRMREHLAARPKDRHGIHEYSFDDLGLDLVEARSRFTAYMERYGVPSEI